MTFLTDIHIKFSEARKNCIHCCSSMFHGGKNTQRCSYSRCWMDGPAEKGGPDTGLEGDGREKKADSSVKSRGGGVLACESILVSPKSQ